MNKFGMIFALLISFSVGSGFAQTQLNLKLDLNDDDSSSLFDSVLNNGTTYPTLDPNNPNSVGHFRVNYSDPAYPRSITTLAYILSQDQSLRIQCSAQIDRFGSLNDRCFINIDSSKSDPSKTVFSEGKYKNSISIVFSDTNDIEAISKALQNGDGFFAYQSQELVLATDANGIKSGQPLLQLSCGVAIGSNTPEPCKALISLRP